ncbi:hypothetical protein [Scleromatobacter humisilvae]|uniref:Uncharacterized protein n=1 Tax=Scleromatobacter humisilvae TaxID=2897159 RepID=A0A9X2BZN4_9BURK|nr:hypothetical protein [Scleromatobacter humisilvae]MCK9686522.1 hypothetical protein [Scleromatobacter humisilvae]
MTQTRYSAVPPYARDVVPAVGLALFAYRAASPALSGSHPMTITGWILTALFCAGSLLMLSLAARAQWVRVEGDDLTSWTGLRPWHKERRPLSTVWVAAPVAHGTAIRFADGVTWRVPGSYRGGEALGRWVIGNGIRSETGPAV